jgi:demethylmenaquinone methyltransferase/2-methoxy-6-polyprenyl-1,4-benzoquinol methylase
VDRQLLRQASDVTAVDASPEMLAIAAARVGNERVRFIAADLFTWKPDRRYDVGFFGFWLSHVPAARLRPSGRWWLTASNQRDGVLRRRPREGPAQPADLERRLRQLGWHIKVTATAGPFYRGAGSLSRRLSERGR